MSHFTSLTTEIKDLEACKNALKNMGLSLKEKGMCRYYYGTELKENVVRLPGKYDMALEGNVNGTYSITADFYEGDVVRTIGDNGCVLLRQYGEEVIKKKAKQMHLSIVQQKDGFRVRNPQDPNGGYMIVTFGENGEMFFTPKGIKGKSCSKFLELEEALGRIDKREFLPEYYETEKERTKATNQQERLKVGDY